MVEGARLESVCGGNLTVGSNPTLSAFWIRKPNHEEVIIRLQGGCTIGAREPRQVRKEATVVGYPM